MMYCTYNCCPLLFGILIAKQMLLHCNKNPIYVFLFWEERGLSPNFNINVSVSDL